MSPPLFQLEIFTPSVLETLQQGIVTTLWISSASAFIAIWLGLLVAFFQLSPYKPLQWIASCYVALIRNTPFLIQLYLLYKGLPSVGVSWSAELCGLIGLSLYSGAYCAEIFRSALLALPKEQTDNALALGLTPKACFMLIQLPQAIGFSLPALANQLVSLLKNSSLLFYITVEETFQWVYRGAVTDFHPAEYFTVGALLYMGFCLGVSLLVRLLEKTLPNWQRWLLIPRHLQVQPLKLNKKPEKKPC
jgi:His/Glu/Gln/Arg/opine family amino acid ABC transporter permease subunit